MGAALLQRLQSNPAGRDYVVGDIHGYFHVLEALLARIGFDRQHDRLFSVGDLIDRGPESGRACEFLSQPWFHATRGNHEDMLLRGAHTVAAASTDRGAAQLWVANGGDWFFRLDAEAQAHIYRDILTLAHAIEVPLPGDRVAALVHADVLDDSWHVTRAFLTGAEARDHEDAAMQLLWSRDRAHAVERALAGRTRGAADALSVAGADLIFFGHTPMRRPIACGNTRWLDAGVAHGGQLAVAELRVDGAVWTMPLDLDATRTGWAVVD